MNKIAIINEISPFILSTLNKVSDKGKVLDYLTVLEYRRHSFEATRTYNAGGFFFPIYLKEKYTEVVDHSVYLLDQSKHCKVTYDAGSRVVKLGVRAEDKSLMVFAIDYQFTLEFCKSEPNKFVLALKTILDAMLDKLPAHLWKT